MEGLIRLVQRLPVRLHDATTVVGDQAAAVAGTARRNAGIHARIPPVSL